MLLEAPQREYRLWILDSRRWRRYTPRSDDIVIATYPKCGIATSPESDEAANHDPHLTSINR